MSVPARTVARISVTPVRGFALIHPDEVELTLDGVVGDRRFLLVDADGKRLRSSLTAWPIVVSGEYDAAAERLRLRFPDGADVEESALGARSSRAIGTNASRPSRATTCGSCVQRRRTACATRRPLSSPGRRSNGSSVRPAA